jgi:class 3 adenylate cyclase
VWWHVLIVIVGVLGLIGLALALQSRFHSEHKSKKQLVQPLVCVPVAGHQEMPQRATRMTWWQRSAMGWQREMARDSRFLYRTIQLINGASSLDDMELVVRELTRHVAADLGRVFLLDDDELLQLSVSVGSLSKQEPVPNWEFTLPNLALAADKPIVIPDLRRWPPLQSFISTPELASTLWLPLKTGGQAAGVLGLGSRRPNAFDQDTVAMVAAVASCLATTIENSRLRRQTKQEKVFRQTLQRYVSPRLVTSVRQVPEHQGHSIIEADRQITVLFADVRGFTSLMEKADPGALLQVLNEYFLRMSQIIQANGGMVDEFIGDQIVASFDRLSPHVNDAYRAVRAGVEMLTALRTLQKRWRDRGLPAFDIGIGISTGSVTRGSIGSHERKVLVALGSILNVASRVEDMNKKFGTHLIITQSTFEQVTDLIEYDALGSQTLQGISEPVPLYSVQGMKNNHWPETKVSHDPNGIAQVTQRRQAFAERSSSGVGTGLLP